MKNASSPTWFSGRTKLITFASVLAVGLAGGAAVSANLGILNATDDNSNVGTLSAAGDLVAPADQVLDVYLPTSTAVATTLAPAASAPSASTQVYAVDAAGTVSVSTTASGLRLDSVEPAPGWTWSLAQPGPGELKVTFAGSGRTLEFTAVQAADGTVVASVGEPVLVGAPEQAGPAPVAASGRTDDNGYEGGDDDD